MGDMTSEQTQEIISLCCLASENPEYSSERRTQLSDACAEDQELPVFDYNDLGIFS